MGDTIAFSSKAEALRCQVLTKGGVNLPVVINLELRKYLNKRGSKKLMFEPEQELKDPYGIQKEFVIEKAKGLRL